MLLPDVQAQTLLWRGVGNIRQSTVQLHAASRRRRPSRQHVAILQPCPPTANPQIPNNPPSASTSSAVLFPPNSEIAAVMCGLYKGAGVHDEDEEVDDVSLAIRSLKKAKEDASNAGDA